MSAAKAFLRQNDRAAETLKKKEIANFAEWHAGGLFVLWGELAEPSDDLTMVKMHDCWGGSDFVVVHRYNPEYPDDDVVEEFVTGREAFGRFVALVEGGHLRTPEEA